VIIFQIRFIRIFKEKHMYGGETAVLLNPHSMAPVDDPAVVVSRVEDFVARYRCLVVDDDPIILQVVAQMLETLGFLADMAQDGVQALGRMSVRHYDLVLTDLDMPMLSGYHLASQIKEKFEDTKIIIMTGHCQAELNDMMETHVADAWLFKPFSLKQLCGLMNDFSFLPSAQSYSFVRDISISNGKRHQV